jgi:REP element-mobilizing transposase RayT
LTTLQRQYFLTMEKNLDAGHGHPWLASSTAAEILVNELASLRTQGVDVPHYTIMPNHWHALLIPSSNCILSLSQMMRTIKGRSARRINAALGRTGTFWQREWFDRWMRDDAEWARCVTYIRQNPVKARLALTWPEHPWTK